MRRVQHHEILDWQTYGEVRPQCRAQALAVKAPRRVHLGEFLTLLFENTLTVRYQIQEMIWAERIVRAADIQHEIDTYNDLLGPAGTLACTLLVEIEAGAERDARLRAWWELPEKIYLQLEDGSRVHARFDARQRGEGRLSSVQYLQFDVGGRTPVAAGVELPGLIESVAFSAATRRALSEDLAGQEIPDVA
jgi:hypothetical protein